LIDSFFNYANLGLAELGGREEVVKSQVELTTHLEASLSNIEGGSDPRGIVKENSYWAVWI
jgi:hypothetical protein